MSGEQSGVETRSVPMPLLQSERVLLRPLSRQDVRDVFEYASDEEIARFVSFAPHVSEADSLEWIDLEIARYERNEPGVWAIELRETGRVVGSIGYVRWAPDDATAELGCALHRALWRHGLMTEVAQLVIDYTFVETEVYRIEARCEPENVGSSKLIEKLGFTREGCLRGVAWVKGDHRDMLVHSILRPEWSSLSGH